MPKPLSKSQPTSSVASLLQPGVGAAALAAPPARSEVLLPTPIVEQLPAVPRPSEPTGELATVLRQFTLTAAADRTLKELTATYSRATGLDLKHSEVLRAVL